MKVILHHGRMVGAILIGETDLEVSKYSKRAYLLVRMVCVTGCVFL